MSQTDFWWIHAEISKEYGIMTPVAQNALSKKTSRQYLRANSNFVPKHVLIGEIKVLIDIADVLTIQRSSTGKQEKYDPNSWTFRTPTWRVRMGGINQVTKIKTNPTKGRDQQWIKGHFLGTHAITGGHRKLACHIGDRSVDNSPCSLLDSTSPLFVSCACLHCIS
jgi:hypothetical protein